jgi:hypothetical protein
MNRGQAEGIRQQGYMYYFNAKNPACGMAASADELD